MGTLIHLFLLVLASSKYVVPLPSVTANVEGEFCSSECTDGIGSGGITFTENVKHGYEFSGKTIIVAPISDPQGTSEVSIRGIVNVIGTKKCGAIVYLKNIEVTQGSKTVGNTKLEGYPILISYNNGKIGSKICSLAKDSAASMNLKRAIVSAFQVSSVQEQKNQLFETDVQGTCNTTYSMSSAGQSNMITKFKDLSQCTGYDKINLLASQSQFSQNYEASPFSKAIQQSQVQVIQSIIKSVSSREALVYQPFGAKDALTKIIISMNLNLKKRSSTNAPNLKLDKPRSIIFEKSSSMLESVNADGLVNALQSAMSNLEPVVEMDGAKDYANLIELLKVANKDDILSAYQQIKSNTGSNGNGNANMAEKVFIDALIAANGGESIEAVVDLINKNELSDSLAVSWFKNVANAKNPTKEAVLATSNLLDKRALKEGYIGVGTLLQQYLKDTQDYESPEVENALNNIGTPLKRMLENPDTSENEDLAIASLKGIGNVNYINSNTEDLVVQTLMKKDVSQRIRAAALAMVKNYATNSNVEKACESIFTDMSEDSEMRILAFKAYVLNPSNNKAAVIKSVLDNKKNQIQIQAFVLSYLSNLKTTADENKLDQKKFYEGIKSMSSKRSLSDILRYSQNLELSHQCPLTHSGVLLNGDVIYSYKSFLARSSSVSLKALVFGHQRNIFDFDVRVENIESVFEKLFGPGGYFSKSNEHPLMDVANYVNQAINYAKERRLNNVDSELTTEEDNASNKDMKKIYVDLALKVLGNDLGWLAFQGLESQVTYQHIIDAILKNIDSSALSDYKNVELNVGKQLSVIDYEKIYTTCSGLPISLKIQATAAMKMNLATKFDLESYIKHPENANFALKIVPSGSLALNALLTVNGHVVNVGYKVGSTLHTSTGSDLSIETIEGRGFEIVYNLPLDVIDLFSVKTGAYAIVQEKGSPMNETPLMPNNVERQSYTRTFDSLANTTGLGYYVQYEFPWTGDLHSLLPFSGPSSFSFKVLKQDPSLTKYALKGIYDFQSPTSKYIKFTSKTGARNVLELNIAHESEPNKKILAEFKTPSSNITLESTIVDTDKQKTIAIQYTGGSEYSLNLGVKSEEADDDMTKYSPVFEIEQKDQASTQKDLQPSQPIIKVEGYVLVKFNDSSPVEYPSKIALKDIAFVTSKNKHSLQGSLSVDNNEIKGESSLSTSGITINTQGYLNGNHPNYKASGSFGMVRSVSGLESSGEQQRSLVLDDESEPYQPNSKLFALLHKIKTLNMSTSQELHVSSPYKFISNNQILWNDDHFEMGGDIQVKDNELTMYGNLSTSNLFDLALNGNLNILPKTENSGVLVDMFVEHSANSDSTNTGKAYLKFVQDSDKSGSYFELNSECPQILGTFNLNTKNHFANDKLEFDLNYNSNSVALTAGLNAEPRDATFKLNFDYPKNPYYKSSVNAHAWLEKEKTYLFQTKLLWPGAPSLNYLNADGTVFLNGYQSKMAGNVDWPSANLRNVQVAIENSPDSEAQDGSVAIVRCTSNNQQVLFSKMFKYTLSLNNGKVYVAGRSIQDDSENYVPINFMLQYDKYTDSFNNVGGELSYGIELDYNGQRHTNQRMIQVTKNVFNYNQNYKIDDDEQQISLNSEYNFTDVWHWYYNLHSRVDSPSVFHYLVHDDQNILECDSGVKVNGLSVNIEHALKIFTPEGLSESYELKSMMNDETAALKLLYGQRDIRGVAHYGLDSIDGGYSCSFSGNLWLDYQTDSDAKSSLSLDSHYSIADGYRSLSTATDLQMYVPTFNNDKEMSIKTTLQLLKSWENPMYAKIDLNIFPTVEQALEVQTSFNRNNQDDGVLYSGEIIAKSDGMELDYLIKDSLFVSSEKWGKYFDASFIDSENTERPIQLHFELVPKGLTNKINLFNIVVINVDSTIDVGENLNTRSMIIYNDHPYQVGLELTSYPSINLLLGWNDKTGNFEQLKIVGSLTMDDSAVVSATHIKNNGEDVLSVGSVQKSLKRENWWETDNQLDSNEWNSVWQSLKREFIERFINVNANIKNIINVAKKQRRVRMREAKKAKPQHDLILDYVNSETRQILNEVANDDYLLSVPFLALNTTKALLPNAIDLYKHVDLDGYKKLNGDVEKYAKKMADYYKEQNKLLLDKLRRGHKQLFNELKLTLIDMYNILNKYTDKPVNDLSSTEPHSLNEYLNDVICKCMNVIKELKDTMDNLQVASLNYIEKMPIYDMFYDQIEKLKTYPYKEKLWENIQKYLHELEAKSPTKDFSRFISALEKYLDTVIHDRPVDPRDVINLRNKTIIVAKSFIMDFSDYVSYDKGMTVYNAMRKLTDVGKTALYIVSPNSFQHLSNGQGTILDLSDLSQLYQRYLNPSNLVPPFKAQGVIVGSNNIITYNQQSYTFMPDTGSYVLAQDSVNNKFSLIGTYDNNVLTSISLSTNNGDTYSIMSGGSVTVNGRNVGFPLMNENVKAWKDIYFFGIDSAVGVSIKSTLQFDIVEVFINGYYYGQVVGLLGSMSQEPSFDFKLPDGNLSDDMTSFVMAYRSSGNTVPTVPDQVQTDQKPCPSLFSGISSLKPIFQTIPPTSYRAMCNQVVSTATSQQDALEKACMVARAYVTMARENHMSSYNIPDMCITSTVGTRTLTTSSNVQINAPSDAADVMILIEEVAENQPIVMEVMKSFMDKITQNFNYKEISDVNFIIVGYSEESGKPDVHIYTANQDTNYDDLLNNIPEWSSFSPQNLSDTYARLKEYTNNRYVQSIKEVMGGQSSKETAYKLSANYPFRPNAVKIVMSVIQNLDQSSSEVFSYTFNYIKSFYIDQGIKFYLVAPINLSDSSDSGIFGASGQNTIYTMAMPKGKESLEGYTYDKSSETELALKTNGAIFDSLSYIEGTDSQQKNFLRSLCRTIVVNAVQDARAAKRCTVSVLNGIMPYVKCTVVVDQ